MCDTDVSFWRMPDLPQNQVREFHDCRRPRYTQSLRFACVRDKKLKQDYLQMKVLELAPQVYVSGQVFESDLKLAADQDVRTIVNNRLDDETIGQPKSADLAKAAEALGMVFVHFPLESRSISKETAEEFASLVEGLERPLLIFSASGVRSTKLWEMSE